MKEKNGSRAWRYVAALLFIAALASVFWLLRDRMREFYDCYLAYALPGTWLLVALVAAAIIIPCINAVLKSWRASSLEVVLLMTLSFALIGAFIGYVFGFFWQIDEFPLWQHTMLAMMGLGALAAVVCLLYPDPDPSKMEGLTKVDRNNEPRLYSIMEGLCGKAGCPMPPLYIDERKELNAYTFGKYKSRQGIVIMRPMLAFLEDDEIEGILGHELSHMLHRDVALMTSASTCARVLCAFSVVVGIVSLVGTAILGASASSSSKKSSDGGEGILFLILLVIFIPIIIVGAVLYLAVPLAAVTMAPGLSRSREFGADEGSAMITGNPLALASALTKMDLAYTMIKTGLKPGTRADLMIIDPFDPKKMKIKDRLLRSHPGTADRVKRLEMLDKKMRA